MEINYLLLLDRLWVHNLQACKYLQLLNKLWARLHGQTVALLVAGCPVGQISQKNRRLLDALSRVQARAFHRNRIVSAIIAAGMPTDSRRSRFGRIDI
jgi:hypothetical protein